MSWLGWWKNDNLKATYDVTRYNEYSNLSCKWVDDTNSGIIVNGFGPFDATPNVSGISRRDRDFVCYVRFKTVPRTTDALTQLYAVDVKTNKNFSIVQGFSTLKMVFEKILLPSGTIQIPSKCEGWTPTEWITETVSLRGSASNSYSEVMIKAPDQNKTVTKTVSVSNNTLIFECQLLYIKGDVKDSSLIFGVNKINITEIPLITVTYENYNSMTINKTILMNQRNNTNNIDLLVSGEIPLWICDKLLPLSTKGYFNGNGQIVSSTTSGTKYHIEKINDNPFSEIDSSINFGTSKNVNLSSDLWSGVYIKYITLSEYYKNRSKPFKYCQGDSIVDSNYTYIRDPEKDDIREIEVDGSTLNIYFNQQISTNFLNKYVKEDNTLVFDLIDIETFSSVIEQLNPSSITNIQIILDEMVLKQLGDLFDTSFTDKIINKVKFEYSYGTDSQGIKELNVTPIYKITDLYCINTQEITSGDFIPNVNFQGDITYDNLYLTNVKAPSNVSATNVNLIVDGNITKFYYDGLPEGVDTLNAPPVPGEIVQKKTCMNLIDIHDSSDIVKDKFGVTRDGEFIQTIFISFILAYDNSDIRNKFNEFDLKSSNSNITDNETDELYDDEFKDTEYLDTIIRYERDDLIYQIVPDSSINEIIFRINIQRTNNFLRSVEETVDNETKIYTDIFLNKTLSAVFKDLTESEFHIEVSELILTKKYTVTFNADENDNYIRDLGNVRIYYYNGDEQYAYETRIAETSTYSVLNLLIVYGDWIIEDSQDKLIPEPVDWLMDNEEHRVFNREIDDNGETTKISIDFPVTKELEIYVDVSHIYSINTFITNNVYWDLNLVVSGEIPQWVYEELLPLDRYLNSSKEVSSVREYCKLCYINDKSFGNSLTFKISSKDLNGQPVFSSIDLTNIANSEAFEKLSYGRLNFFVDKIKLLKRFENQYLPFRNVQQNTPEYTFVDDWSLKLPDCYKDCEINQDKLNINFSEYEQINNQYLLTDIVDNKNMYLDISTSLLSIEGLDNVTTINLNLEVLKYFVYEKDCGLCLYPNGNYINQIYLLYNLDGFIKTKVFYESNIFQFIINCYTVYGENKIETISGKNVRLVKPSINQFSLNENEEFIGFRHIIGKYGNITITNLYRTNLGGDFRNFKEMNLLISGEIPDWLFKYFGDQYALPLKLKFNRYQYPYGYIYNFTNDDDYNLLITSINALPAPNSGIDNESLSDQCTMDLTQVLNN